MLWNPTYDHKTYGGRSLVVAGPPLWNRLPQSVKDSTSVDTFKRRPQEKSAYYSYPGLTMDADFHVYCFIVVLQPLNLVSLYSQRILKAVKCC